MKNLWETGALKRIVALTILIILSGISPRPHSVALELVRANQTLGFGNLSAFAKKLALVAEKNPWRVDLWETAGHYALEGNQPEAAIQYFKESAARGALSPEGYRHFADAYEQTDNMFTALQIWEAGVQIFGESIDSRTRMADAHRKLDDYPALVEDLKVLLYLKSTSLSIDETAEINYEIGLLLAAYRPESAPAYLIQAFEANPALTEGRQLSFTIQRALSNDNPTYTLMAAGQKLADLNHWDLAFRAFQNAAKIQPDYAEAWAYIGESWQHLAVPDDAAARTALEKALEINPQSLPANIFMSLYWQRHLDFESAIGYLKTAAKIDPNNPDILTDLGAVSAISGDLKAAQVYYTKAIEISSRAPAYLHATIIFCIRYNYDIKAVALPLAREALSKNASNPQSLTVMGQVLIRLGDLNNAERFLVQAIHENSKYAPAHLHLGTLYQLQGKTILARDHLEIAVHLAPGTSTETQAKRILNGNDIP